MITVEPTPTIVTIPVDVTVATAVLLFVYVTAKPEEAVAAKVKFGSPTTLAAIAPNVIVWLAFPTTKVCVTAVAAL